MENISILKNWYLVTVDMNIYKSCNKLAHNILITYDMLNNPNIQLPNDQHGPAIFLVGEVYNKTGFVGGKKIVTSTIKKIANHIAITYSGSKYELCEMHPHYKAFCNHIAQNKPVLYNFCIGKIRAFDNSEYKSYELSKKIYVTGNCFMDGKMKFILEEISDINTDNFTLKTSSGIEYFVVWSSWHFATRTFSYQDYSIFIPISIENHHYMKTFENNKEKCFLYDETFGDIQDIIGTTSDGKKECIPIMKRSTEKQKENTFLSPNN